MRPLYPGRVRIWAALMIASFALTTCVSLQAAEDTERHPKVMVQPEYPELARQMNMKGTVRLQLLVAADGHLKETKVLGGNPVLVQASLAAVRKWKYEPAKSETTVVVKFDFDPSGTTVK
ncbi:MAG TPA: energy transducer TonB [Terriglobales bacterium]|nr:energy transducer TonB [Terriglobales bacterium]